MRMGTGPFGSWEFGRGWPSLARFWFAEEVVDGGDIEGQVGSGLGNGNAQSCTGKVAGGGIVQETLGRRAESMEFTK